MTEDARIKADLLVLREDLARVQGRMEGMDMEYKRMLGAIEQLQGISGKAGSMSRRLDQLERGIAELNTARAKDRELIIEELTGKISDILARQGSAGAGAGATGYEHIVQAGETLSEIASAYKVRASAIIEANNLTNPDMLRQGQKLFIPR